MILSSLTFSCKEGATYLHDSEIHIGWPKLWIAIVAAKILAFSA